MKVVQHNNRLYYRICVFVYLFLTICEILQSNPCERNLPTTGANQGVYHAKNQISQSGISSSIGGNQVEICYSQQNSLWIAFWVNLKEYKNVLAWGPMGITGSQKHLNNISLNNRNTRNYFVSQQCSSLSVGTYIALSLALIPPIDDLWNSMKSGYFDLSSNKVENTASYCVG